MQVWVVHAMLAMLGKKRTKLVEARKGYRQGKMGCGETDNLQSWRFFALLASFSFLPRSSFLVTLLFSLSTPALPTDRLVRKNRKNRKMRFALNT